MIKRFLILVFAFLSISALAETFETEDYFSITLPEGWVPVPPDLLVQASEALYPDEPIQSYDYGFQSQASDNQLIFPFILAQVNYVGRYSTGELERFAESSMGNDGTVDNEKALFMEMRQKDGFNVLVARQLTEYGYIEFSGFADTETFAEYESVFREAFSSLGIDDVIRYQPQITDNAPVVGDINVGKVLVVFLQAALVGGVLWFIYGTIRNRLKRSLKSA